MRVGLGREVASCTVFGLEAHFMEKGKRSIEGVSTPRSVQHLSWKACVETNIPFKKYAFCERSKLLGWRPVASLSSATQNASLQAEHFTEISG